MNGSPPVPPSGSERATVTFRFAGTGSAKLRAVRLWQEVGLPAEFLRFFRYRNDWRLEAPRPAVDRMEYLFELTRSNGVTEAICDPDEPRRVGGAFGEHSVREFPEYRAPAWLDRAVEPGGWTDLEVAVPGLGQHLIGSVWSAPGLRPDEPAGLLVVHDGPEYERLAAFTHYLSAMTGAGVVPPLRAALLAPGPRNDWYSANDTYARALTEGVLPHLRWTWPATSVVGVGTSLGALAMLMAHRAAPDAFDGLFLQSGSFFQSATDDQERAFPAFARITDAVARVLDADVARRPVPVVLTCGGIEENLANNQAMRRALAGQGYPVVLREVRDVHNYTAWRDAFDPHLTELLRQVLPARPR